jgi:thiosulfate/3-mercaptopyruvate sulfurtransferase
MRRALPLAAIVLFISQIAFAQTRVPVPRTNLRASMVVQTAWLERHLSDPNLVVLQIGRDPNEFEQHIPGARFIKLSELAVRRGDAVNELPADSDIAKLFGNLGVSDNDRVILYDNAGGLFAARAYFTLDYAGHGDRAALLDGGLKKWIAEKRGLTAESAAIRPTTFTVNANRKLVVDLAQMQELVQRAKIGDAALLDARPYDQYTGEKPFAGIRRSGHIPGAESVPWITTLESADDPVLVPESELRHLFADAGVRRGNPVITYCVTGIQAAHLYFVLKFLGYSPKLYDGSFMEWSNAPDTEVATGSTPNSAAR